MPLDPEISAYLETQRHQPPRSALDIAATRQRLRQSAALAGPPPTLARVDDLVLAGYLRARQYWPAADATLPLVVYFHGGRFISGDLDSHDTICRILALAAGCRVLAVDYRLAPEHRFPAAADDAVGGRMGAGAGKSRRCSWR
jgi:acetyl esterase